MTEQDNTMETQVENSKEEKDNPVPFDVKNTSEEDGSIHRYSVEIGRNHLDDKMSEVLQELRKTVAIEGFRPGKAPLNLLRIRFGKDAEKDALNDLAKNVAGQIVEKESLDVIGDAALHDFKVEEGKPVCLDVDIEVRPQLDVKGYTGNTFEVEVPEVSDEQVEDQLKQIQEANATFEEPKDKNKGFAKGNAVTLDIKVTDKDGQPLQSLCQMDQFVRDPFENLPSEVAEAMLDKKAGDVVEQAVERTVTNREKEEVTYRDTYVVTIKDVQVRKVPRLDDDFAMDVGDFKDLSALRDRIRSDLQQQADDQKRQNAMDKILSHLIEENPFPAPRTIVAAQEYQTIMRDSNQLEQMGMSFEDLGVTPDGYLEQARANSERFVKINMLVNAIAKQESLEVTDADVDKEIERRAEAEGRKPLAIRARLEAERRLDGLKRELIVGKVEDFLMSNNTLDIKTVGLDKQGDSA